MNKAFIPKDDQELPDFFKVVIYYVSGVKEEINVASYQFIQATGMIEIITHEDLYRWIIMQNVLKVEFDKNFTKMIEIRQKIEKEKLAKGN